ncbi:MAG TPA: NADH-quinone oxidoreductase subunit NuoH [Nitrososphaerales archaeon]|nr:NADH-quinone oxidoreductase subunit NuoH [Nitrososphaerales archaeon]
MKQTGKWTRLAELTTFEDFIKRVFMIVIWVLVFLPFAILPIFYLVYVLPVEIQCNFAVYGCTHTIDWSVALYMFTPNQLNPFDPTSFISSLGLGANSILFKAGFFPGLTFVALLSSMVIWYERKLLAKMQYRVGPLYAGRIGGILQSFADLFKLLFKEVVIPAKADRLMFLAPVFAMMALAGALIGIIPIGSGEYIASSPYSLLIALAIVSFFPLITLLAGWASNNKFSFIGAIRALYQMISYEIPLILSVIGVIILSGSLDFVGIVNAQNRVWFIGPMILGAIVFYITAMAEVERIPFDLPEADSELVAGWLTEYTSMVFGTINLAMYIKLYAMSAIFTLLFLGGWSGPEPIPDFVWFLIKTLIVMTIFIIPRGANPRIRLDQLINFGWVWLIALAFINTLVALLLVAYGIL